MEYKSSVVENLEKELERFNRTALNKCREEVISKNNPLIERIEGNNKELLVTLLYEEDEWQEHISVYASYDGWGGTEKELKRIRDTNIWYRSFKIRNVFTDISALSSNYVIKIIQYKVRYRYKAA